MKISDRIQNLRKVRGMSQEGLVDQIVVSRKAVSKWESEQSVPELDKIILISEIFDVTIDYILKGTESTTAIKTKLNAFVFVIVGTVLNFIGLLVSA